MLLVNNIHPVLSSFPLDPESVEKSPSDQGPALVFWEQVELDKSGEGGRSRSWPKKKSKSIPF